MRNVIILDAGTFAKEITDEIDNVLNVVCYVVEDKYYHSQLNVVPLSKFKNDYSELYYLLRFRYLTNNCFCVIFNYHQIYGDYTND